MSDQNPPAVHIVDDDAPLRDSLQWLLESAGCGVATYASAEEFLEKYDSRMGGCLLLDIRMHGMSGLELQDELKRRGHRIPIVFMTGHGDVPIAVTAVKKGAVEFLEKPFNDQALLMAIDSAVEVEADARRSAARFTGLTRREREVMDRIVAGRRNQDIATELAISIKTVEVHRAAVMSKMGADSLAALVKLVQTASR